MSLGRILVVDDEESMCQYLSILLSKEGYEVATANSGFEALRHLENQPCDVVMTDIQMPKMDGIQLLKGVKAADPGMPVVMMTAYASEQSAIDAVNLGAFSYLQKHCKNDEFKIVVRNAMQLRRFEAENRQLKRELKGKKSKQRIIGQSARMRSVFKMIDKIAATPATVLINGESGTGKELVARAIHDRSQRAGGLLRGHQLRRHPRDPAREPALRAREGVVHRRRPRPRRLLPAGQRRHHLPGRDRRDAAVHAGQAAADAPGAGGHPRRQHGADQGRPARHRGHQPRSRGGGRQRQLPHRPVLPAQRDPARPAGAARAPRRHPPARRSLPAPLLPRRVQGQSGLDGRRGRHAGPAGLRLARQRARAGERDRTREHHARRARASPWPTCRRPCARRGRPRCRAPWSSAVW